MSTPLSPEMAASLFLTPMRHSGVESRTPSQVPDRMISTPAGRIATWQRGDGPQVLLVHGWSSTHADLVHFVDPLLAAGRQVISMDLPAHGKSDGQVASILELASGILHVARAFGPADAVIAHSVGCAAVGVALQRGMAVNRTVLIAPPARYTDFACAFARQAGVDPLALLAALRRRGIDMDSVDYPTMAPSLNSSALVIHSTDDQVVPFADGQEIAAAWPGAQFVACEGLGHRRILADSNVVSAALKFLSN